jgi:hypothetical protein
MAADIPVLFRPFCIRVNAEGDDEWTTGPGLHSCRGPCGARILHIDFPVCTPQRNNPPVSWPRAPLARLAARRLRVSRRETRQQLRCAYPACSLLLPATAAARDEKVARSAG